MELTVLKFLNYDKYTMISMTKNDMRCNILNHQGDANEGFITMHTFVHYRRYRTAAHSPLEMLHTNFLRLSVIS